MNSLVRLCQIALLLICLNLNCQAQQPTNGFSASAGHSHALIIGISDYANIDDLEFADKDARVFREYLLNTMESQADSSNITMLLNKAAVSTSIYQALENLVSMVAEGDRVYIYFSGHGDSENTTIFRSGFLLTHDTPASCYYTNSINVEILNNFINTLSAQNKADVVFIADACRSGNLGSTGGMMQTARALTQNTADEIRMLSCQPEEISLEGKQWGNGRGLFSYHLINGLYGMADVPAQSDGKVILNELSVYLSTHVPRDADPVRQFPGIYGPMGKVISRVQPDVIARMKDDKGSSGLSNSISHSQGKGYEDQFLTALNNAQLADYRSFGESLDEGRLRLPGGNNAAHFLDKLRDSGIDPVFLTLLERNLISALLEEPQRYIHQLADVSKRWNQKDIKYLKWSEDILLSAEMLGEDHYMHNTLMAKHHFFAAAEQYFAAREAGSGSKSKALASAALNRIEKAITLDPLVVYYYNLKGAALTLTGDYKLAQATFDRAIEISPEYPYPYANKGRALIFDGKYEEAITNLDICIRLDSGYTNAWQYKITALKKLGRNDEAMEVYRQMLGAGKIKGM